MPLGGITGSGPEEPADYAHEAVQPAAPSLGRLPAQVLGEIGQYVYSHPDFAQGAADLGALRRLDHHILGGLSQANRMDRHWAQIDRIHRWVCELQPELLVLAKGPLLALLPKGRKQTLLENKVTANASGDWRGLLSGFTTAEKDAYAIRYLERYSDESHAPKLAALGAVADLLGVDGRSAVFKVLAVNELGLISYLAAPWLAHFNLFTPDEQGIVVDKIRTASPETSALLINGLGETLRSMDDDSWTVVWGRARSMPGYYKAMAYGGVIKAAQRCTPKALEELAEDVLNLSNADYRVRTIAAIAPRLSVFSPERRDQLARAGISSLGMFGWQAFIGLASALDVLEPQRQNEVLQCVSTYEYEFEKYQMLAAVGPHAGCLSVPMREASLIDLLTNPSPSAQDALQAWFEPGEALSERFFQALEKAGMPARAELIVAMAPRFETLKPEQQWQLINAAWACKDKHQIRALGALVEGLKQVRQLPPEPRRQDAEGALRMTD